MTGAQAMRALQYSPFFKIRPLPSATLQGPPPRSACWPMATWGSDPAHGKKYKEALPLAAMGCGGWQAARGSPPPLPPLTLSSPPACRRASRSAPQAQAPPRRLQPRSATTCGWRPPSGRQERVPSWHRRRCCRARLQGGTACVSGQLSPGGSGPPPSPRCHPSAPARVLTGRRRPGQGPAL